jgi:hypothetical protein
MKKVRSLKIEVPPAEELALACEQIVQKIASFDPERDKIQTIYSSEAEQQHGEDVIDQITILLRAHKRPELSETMIYIKLYGLPPTYPSLQRRQQLRIKSPKRLLQVPTSYSASSEIPTFLHTTSSAFLGRAIGGM